MMLSILLVEDNEMNRDMIGRHLDYYGYTVLTADNGMDAVSIARSAAPDLILMDMSLPGLDGWEATRQIKAAPETRSIPVIAITAHAMETERRPSRRAATTAPPSPTTSPG